MTMLLDNAETSEDSTKGTDLYLYVGGNPINRVDPSGLQAASGPTTATQPAKLVFSNKYGDFFAIQTNKNIKLGVDNAVTESGTSHIEITFKPTTKCGAESLGFIQIVRMTDKDGKAIAPSDSSELTRLTTNMWFIDRLRGRDYGWYGTTNAGTSDGNWAPGTGVVGKPVVDAFMKDTPQATHLNETHTFQTFVANVQKRIIYGGIQWGFQVDDKGLVTSLPIKGLDIADVKVSDIMAAIAAWNTQSKGYPKSDFVHTKNSDGQISLGDFTIAE